MSRQIIVVSRLRSLAVTPDTAIAAALGDGYRPAETLAQENERLREEIEQLRDEIERIRRLSSAGFCRGMIKQAPVRHWPRRAEMEDML